MVKREKPEPYQRLNVRRRSGSGRRRIVAVVLMVVILGPPLYLVSRWRPEGTLGTGRAKPHDVQVVDENYEKLQRQRNLNRELMDRISRAIQLLDDGKLAGAEKVLKGEDP